MRIIIFIFFCSFLFSCQKEVSHSSNQIVNNTFDSLVGNWKLSYIYRLVTTQANPDVVIDSVYDRSYEPYSYFTINADSTYKWYLTAMQSLPALGYGISGHWYYSDSLRKISLLEERETQDDWGPLTRDIIPPRYGLGYRIKQFGNNRMVLFFRVIAQSNPDHYWWWHDVFVR